MGHVASKTEVTADQWGQKPGYSGLWNGLVVLNGKSLFGETVVREGESERTLGKKGETGFCLWRKCTRFFPARRVSCVYPRRARVPVRAFHGLTTSSPQHTPLTLILQRPHLLHLVHHLALRRGSNMVTDQMTHERIKTEQGAFM